VESRRLECEGKGRDENVALSCKTLYCLVTQCTIQCTMIHYTTLHYTTLHYTTLHYTTLHYTTLHYTTLHYARDIPSEVSVHELAITYRLPNNTSNKLEIVQMIHIYHAQRVGLKGSTVSSSCKQCVVTVKYFTG
jgi:hypothetical protein